MTLLLDDLHHADAAGRGAHHADLQGRGRPRLLDTYAGLTLPLIASATATLLFRQFFLTVPDELVEAARIDGAGPMRFFWTSCCRCRAPTSRRCSSSSSSTAGTSISGRC
jgi:hypothetical protein